MSKPLFPFTAWMEPWIQGSMMIAEAQGVIAMRIWGLAGMWPVVADESRRMVTEKGPAFAEAAAAATAAAMALQTGPQVAMATLKPIRKLTRANHRRLSGGKR
ncbi:hypothetical protein [Wenxinia marina]|uniref:Antifreeze protein n=1 Tax=Wenxinia marina DSM 24838 TaxID=1123501 RepID=A0A0D0PYF5_9RHOB|nr:hypothetical protein [Wenxinia marina]KIQ67464.1 hypothetical protein Wenmar_03887 [Wenxinia marina DSM 24838]GGL69331.1 hypothetical protein GCM10011392_24710 [Wenxinia marina]